MLTTASMTCSATSAMFSGPRAAAGCAAVKQGDATNAAAGTKPVGRVRSNQRTEKRCKFNGSNGMEAGTPGQARHWKYDSARCSCRGWDARLQRGERLMPKIN